MIKKQTRKTWLIALLFLMMPSLLLAQSYGKKTLITIGDKKISAQEFMNTYEKNNINNDVIDKKSVEDYLDLYIDFKIKVTEAEALMMDTSSTFIKELANYRQQLAKPYFSNDEITDELTREAYERMLYDINASHILIRCEANAIPADTLIAYNKAMSIRNRALKGEDFGDLAAELSDDPSARDMEEIPGVRRAYKGNKGNLGYFTVFDMVYPFETGAYNTNEGEISMPVRSDFGYHIIKVNSKTPASGTIKAAHVMVAVDPNDPNKQDSIVQIKINNIYNEILPDGSNWADIVKKYSDDKGTIVTQGQLSPFRVSNIVPEFIAAIKDLEPNEISKPVKTVIGYHIIKLISTATPADFETEQTKLREKVERDMRGQYSEEIAMKRIIKSNRFKENIKVKDAFIATIDSTLTLGKFVVNPEVNTQEVLFSINEASYTIQNFIDYIIKNQQTQGFITETAYAYQLYDDFLKEKVFEYEDAHLEQKYPEFNTLVQEYHDGILLFSLMENQVWNKAAEDSVGLQNFYEKNKHKYMWDNRVKALIVTCNENDDIAVIEKMVRDGVEVDSLRSFIKTNKYKASTRASFFQKGDNVNIDNTEWKVGTIAIYPSTVDNTTQIIRILEVRDPEPKTFKETKGIVTSGYQNEIEAQWIEDLRAKYIVTVNEKLLDKIIKKYNN